MNKKEVKIEKLEAEKLIEEEVLKDEVKNKQDKELEDEKEKEDAIEDFYLKHTPLEEELENTQILLDAA